MGCNIISPSSSCSILRKNAPLLSGHVRLIVVHLLALQLVSQSQSDGQLLARSRSTNSQKTWRKKYKYTKKLLITVTRVKVISYFPPLGTGNIIFHVMRGLSDPRFNFVRLTFSKCTQLYHSGRETWGRPQRWLHTLGKRDLEGIISLAGITSAVCGTELFFARYCGCVYRGWSRAAALGSDCPALTSEGHVFVVPVRCSFLCFRTRAQCRTRPAGRTDQLQTDSPEDTQAQLFSQKTLT